ncbi:MAG TPA: ATP-binding protein, partial [Cyanobacteria bacterium UBA11148]|nr:ATP-binding protein [Cyanobacteria bacterium UBA11148]
MVAIQESSKSLLFFPQGQMPNLSLESTLHELSLHDFQVESSRHGREVAKLLQLNPMLPGVILTQQGKFVGMISRRRFLEQMSRP